METTENKEQAGRTFDGGITEAQIEAFKTRHGKIYRVDVVDGNDTHTGYFRRPDFPTIKAITKISKTDEVEAGKVMFDNCWLGGSEDLRKDAVLLWQCRHSSARCSTAAWVQ